MTNEQKLWQRRAGILSEGEYMDSVEEQPVASVPENAVVGGVKTVQQLRQYFKDLGSGAIKLPTMDSTEVEQLHSFVKDFIDKAGKGSIGTAAKTVKRTFDTGTKSVKI